MNPSLTYAFAALMVVVGVVFIYLIVRPNPRRLPRGVVQWAGVALSVLLIGLGGALAVLTFQVDARQSGRLPTVVASGDEVSQEPAPNFRFVNLASDAEEELAAYRGRVVLLNFWATWCPPCLGELPDLNRLYEDYAADGLAVITISDEDPATIRDFAEEEIPLRTINGYIDAPERLPAPFDRMQTGRPMSYVIDRDGIIRRIVLGQRDYAAFEAMVRPLLAAEPARP
ncbi:MAG: TlpA family protein disulfide reductase [Bacteroidetes bacterium]|nr:MAG: TlpA family protein disulfide reductase [Bacteroidota bacterium]